MRKILVPALLALSATLCHAAGEFRHVVMFKFNSEATADKVLELEKAFHELPKEIPEVQKLEWGTTENVEPKNDGFTHCFLVTFKDREGLKKYLPSAAHQAFLAKLKPYLEKALVFDYTAKE
ncbi:MAG: Stress responsive alpha-beta barrel protein [Akkermansiaceae bacterium]|nr:Stress responsive alpha-beta barrel protein [Akkermansiaceae bacterium]